MIIEGQWDEFQDLRGFYWQQYKPSIVNNRVRSGSHALRNSITWPNNKNWFRSEMIFGENNAPEGTHAPQELEYGKRYRISFSIYVPDLEELHPNLNDVVFQMHGKPDSDDGIKVENPRNPNFALSVTGDMRWRIHTRGDDRRVTPVDKSYQFSHAFNTPLTKDKWTDWVIEILLSYNDDGELRIWKDDELIYEGFHKNTWNDDLGPHCAMGIYSWWMSSRDINTVREYWHDALQIMDITNGVPPPPDNHQEILDRIDTLDKAYSAMAAEQAELSVRLQAQEGNIEDLAQVQAAQADRIERHLKE